MSKPILTDLIIDTDDGFDDASTLTGAQSFVDSLNSPSVFDRLSFKKSYTTSARKVPMTSRGDITNPMVSPSQSVIPDRRRSFPVSSSVEVRRPIMMQSPLPSPKVEKPRSPTNSLKTSKSNKSGNSESSSSSKESVFERMARYETYASASRKPNPVKNKVAQMSTVKKGPGTKKELVEKRLDQPSQHVSESPYEVQRSFSSSSHSSTSLGKEQEE